MFLRNVINLLYHINFSYMNNSFMQRMYLTVLHKDDEHTHSDFEHFG